MARKQAGSDFPSIWVGQGEVYTCSRRWENEGGVDHRAWPRAGRPHEPTILEPGASRSTAPLRPCPLQVEQRSTERLSDILKITQENLLSANPGLRCDLVLSPPQCRASGDQHGGPSAPPGLGEGSPLPSSSVLGLGESRVVQFIHLFTHSFNKYQAPIKCQPLY